MGGTTSFELAGRHPDMLAAAIVLDAAVTLSPAARPAITAFIERLNGPDYESVLRDFVARVFFIPTDSEQRKAEILKAMSATPVHVAVSAFEGVRDYEPDEAAASIAVPVLYVAANEMPPRCDLSRLRDLLPEVSFAQTAGSGHFCQLEVPEQINAMIDRFIAIAVPAGQSAVRDSVSAQSAPARRG
jgi:pimeloyl-ACP methyl ester carboxylesterase